MKPVTPPAQGQTNPGRTNPGQTLAERYGTGRRTANRVAVVVAGVLVLLGLVWLGWAIWSASTPQVQSALSTYEVVDAHEVRASVTVHTRSADVRATCTLQALAEDHSVVGERTFEVHGVEGSTRRELAMRTEREATSVDLVGCTTPDQQRPR